MHTVKQGTYKMAPAAFTIVHAMVATHIGLRTAKFIVNHREFFAAKFIVTHRGLLTALFILATKHITTVLLVTAIPMVRMCSNFGLRRGGARRVTDVKQWGSRATMMDQVGGSIAPLSMWTCSAGEGRRSKTGS